MLENGVYVSFMIFIKFMKFSIFHGMTISDHKQSSHLPSLLKIHGSGPVFQGQLDHYISAQGERTQPAKKGQKGKDPPMKSKPLWNITMDTNIHTKRQWDDISSHMWTSFVTYKYRMCLHIWHMPQDEMFLKKMHTHTCELLTHSIWFLQWMQKCSYCKCQKAYSNKEL